MQLQIESHTHTHWIPPSRSKLICTRRLWISFTFYISVSHICASPFPWAPLNYTRPIHQVVRVDIGRRHTSSHTWISANLATLFFSIDFSRIVCAQQEILYTNLVNACADVSRYVQHDALRFSGASSNISIKSLKPTRRDPWKCVRFTIWMVRAKGMCANGRRVDTTVAGFLWRWNAFRGRSLDGMVSYCTYVVTTLVMFK